jgi:hypothetical protein
MKETISKIKIHVRENKTVYITGISCLSVGVLVTLVGTKQLVVVDSFKFQWKTTTLNEITTVLARRGHPGNIVRCIETGETFASINRTANAMGLNRGNLSAHLSGHIPHVKGYHFEKLGEAA